MNRQPVDSLNEPILTPKTQQPNEADWVEDNSQAICSWNEWVAKNDLPFAQYRQF
jgi:post-segregation antitoxin (ccd killing protein)